MLHLVSSLSLSALSPLSHIALMESSRNLSPDHKNLHTHSHSHTHLCVCAVSRKMLTVCQLWRLSEQVRVREMAGSCASITYTYFCYTYTYLCLFMSGTLATATGLKFAAGSRENESVMRSSSPSASPSCFTLLVLINAVRNVVARVDMLLMQMSPHIRPIVVWL